MRDSLLNTPQSIIDFHKPNFRRIVEDMGYPLEKHIYCTADGCINTVFRIPGKKGTLPSIGQFKENTERKPVVIY
jgi:hypothetical protein